MNPEKVYLRKKKEGETGGVGVTPPVTHITPIIVTIVNFPSTFATE
jgi:hypothetical protein